jgi:two-component system, cell cycle response regulator
MTNRVNSGRRNSQIGSIQSSKILVVDDLPNNLKVLRGLLKNSNYQLIFASSGRQCLDLVQKNRPDLILLDLMMPEMDGIEVCRRLKESPLTAEIPIIFLTASNEPANLIEAFDLGAVDYVTKPFRTSELRARIETHLKLFHLQQKTQQKAEQEKIVRHIVEAIHSSLDIEQLFIRTVSEIRVFLELDRVAIYHYTNSQAYEIAAAGEDAPLTAVFPLLPIEESRSFLVRPDSTDSENTTLLDHWQIHQEFRLPLFDTPGFYGSLIITTRQPDPFTLDLQAALADIASQLEVAIAQAKVVDQLQSTNQKLEQLTEQLEQLANRDGLTQIANRRHLEKRLAYEWRRLLREQRPLSLIMIDIDYFKLYNDTYGHLQGDEGLKAIAATLSQVIKRPADFVARYGGEEFTIVLPNTDTNGALVIAQQAQAAVAQLAIPHAASPLSDRVTLSQGIISRIPSFDLSWQQFLDLADRALYDAKMAGRNTYQIAA